MYTSVGSTGHFLQMLVHAVELYTRMDFTVAEFPDLICILCPGFSKLLLKTCHSCFQGQNTTVKTGNRTWKNFVKELTRKMKVQIHKVNKLSQVKGKVCG